MTALRVKINKGGVSALGKGPLKRAMITALRKAGSTALRDMKSEASKRIRARKRIRPSYIGRAMTLTRAKGTNIDDMRWSVKFSGQAVPLVAYPFKRAAGGVRVEVNKGTSTLVKGAFVAQMRNGHIGIFRRRGPARLPIDELRGSRPVDALLHKGEAQGVADRGGASFNATFRRVFKEQVSK
jgi:hypothetical protein